MTDIPPSSALDTIGTKLNSEIERDAIHVAVLAVQAKHELQAGEHIGLVNGLATNQAEKLLGIVDPWIEDTIHRGEWFWLCVYPRRITSLIHAWTHPDIPDTTPTPVDPEVVEKIRERFLGSAEQWIRNWLNTVDGPSYDTLLRAALDGDLSDEYLSIYGEDASGDIPDELWDKLEIVTGQKFPERPTYFSCSC